MVVMHMENCSYWLCLLILFSFVLLLIAEKVVINLSWKPRKIQYYFLKQGIRGPKYHFLLGNLKEIASFRLSTQLFPFSHDILPRVFSFYHHWKKIYGAIFLVWFGPTARVTISDPALIRDIFILKSDCFEKTETPSFVKKLEGDAKMGRSMSDMLAKWSKMSNGGKVEIEVSEWFETLSEDVITHMVFGNSYEDGKAIFELQARQLVYAIESFQQVFIPGYRFLPTKKNRISWRLNKDVRKSLMNLIEQRRKSLDCDQMQSSDEDPNDLLEVMIKASLRETSDQYTNNSTLNPCSSSIIQVHDIVEECKTMLFAGKYTTSNLLTWTTILLAMHPTWQELARDEVLRDCGARDTPSKDDITKLKTLGMIVNESLRLYPPVVATIRRAKIDTKLGSLKLPRGTELLIPIVAIHHDSALWGDDVNEFNPARFAQGVAQAAKNPMAFMPFGLGARHCIGQNLAVLQAKLAIAMILKCFSFYLAPTYQHAPTVLMFLCPQYGAPIIFKKL
ncbi:cytochrome p450 734a1 [Nicotiana attenuata]|uniref:Cytochrome p450 734a1 n=1 Tax=Nicotiana attenuata TaxID=49451 RepID=A0A1J6IQD5_NICAT|nr:cytochrome p450 734a1 [Nicotiana attenuata]